MALVARLLIVYLCLVQSKCDLYKNRPKIKAVDGDLILEPAYDRNIHIRPNGPQSKVYIGDVNLLGINTTFNSVLNGFNEQVQRDVKVPLEVLQRIDGLEATTSSLSNNFMFNVTFLARRVNTLTSRIRSLQNQINSRNYDECQSRPCANGGTCLNLINGYHCLCPSAWKGRNCDEDVNECRIYAGTDLGCQNGARCINTPGSYECICRQGWFGLDCTRKTKDCSGGDFEMCGHGTCIPVTTGDGIKCLCNQGWTNNETNIACLNDVNECASGQGARCSVIPKVECINLPGTFKCGQCPPGYEGDGFACYDIDECVTIPNGGCSTSPMVSCHNTIGSRICGSCPAGYEGNGVSCTWKGSCAINHGGCHPSAQCVETSALGSQFAQCVCPYGMTGDGVGIHGCYISKSENSSQTCESNPCGVHGRCHSLRLGYTCICDQGYSGIHCDRHNDLCSTNPCLNGGTCRLEENDRGYRCECTALYSGNICQSHSQPCGGVLDAEEGSITYPISNNSYVHNARCAWVIHTVPEKVINVTFSKFNLEYHAQCSYDFVQIHDGRSSASQLIGRFCGNTFPNGGNIVSSHNNLYFWFRSDSTVAKSGFALHWTSVLPKCGGELDATTYGHISSPGSPGPYPPNRDCYWHLKTAVGKRIQLHFYQLDIETHANCSYDYVAIYDGARTLDPLISKYCNSTQPAPLESAGSEILIHFHSDEYGNGKGFQISYAPVDGVPGCGGLFSNSRGELVSPSYDGSYLNNLLCEYKIRTRPNTKIRVKFILFDIERSERCRYDHLSIYDGASTDSQLIGKFCGKTNPNSFISSGNVLYIVFKSDHTMTSGGFKLQYEAVCHNTIFGDSGVIQSPGYPLAYPKQTQCEYIIATTPGKAIQLTFQDFDIEDNRYFNCQYDNVEIRDGPTINSTLMGRFCGGNEFTPPTQISSYNYLYLKFSSDASITGSGFYANYTTIDIECGGIYRESTGIINHPASSIQFYRNDQSCTWMIMAPPGMYIQLTWNRFDLEDMNNCISDYVEIIDAEYANSTLGKYCGTSLPPAITVTSNIVGVKFVSDNSIQQSGFSLSYQFLNEKTHCGGLYIKTHGFIYSPGWPEKYASNKDCTWTITVPVGQRVSLNISDFDLEKPIRETCDLGDHLTIRDGLSESSPLIGKFCGTLKTKLIVSTTRHLYIHFHSDFYLSGKGFKIEFDGTLRGCGGTLNSYSGSISSPNYPQNYDENAVCFYKIVTSEGSRIEIRFTDLDLEDTESCSDDYVEIFDGQNSNSPSFGKYCKSANMTSILTTNNYAFVKFRSDFYLTGKGFLLNYKTVCNNNISGSYGVIESPGYPDKYPLQSNCLWTITVPKGNFINITFSDFSLFESYLSNSPFYRYHLSNSVYVRRPSISRRCDLDYLQFKETFNGNFSDKICGSNLPRAMTSKTNSFQIKFVASYFYSYKGFRLEWAKYGCGSHIQKISGSLDFSDVKQTNGEIECEWLLETPTGTSVELTISDFYLSESKNCTLDAIEIYNGQSAAFPLLTKVCLRGKVTVLSTSNFMFVRLIKRSTVRDIYLLSHFDSKHTQCGGFVESQSGSIHSKNYPKNYDNNIDCIWYISVPKYHRIELNFVDIDLYSDEDSNDRCDDSLKIYDSGRTLTSNYSYLICPRSNVTNIESQYSFIQIQFSTNNDGTAKGFLANFRMVCGAIITAHDDGIINNNNYINSINRNCTWTIIAPNLNQNIKLTIQHLNIPRNLEIATNRNCPSSFLRVYDGDDDQSPLIDEYCGNKVPPMIVSHGNVLTIKFGSYTNSTEGQFSAHFTALSTACGGELTSEEGSIASPNYPLSYPVNIDCEWTLKTSPGNKVYITFEKFGLDESEGCNEDYLEVRESNSGGKILALYCGSSIPTNTTSSSKLFIKFHSDNVKSGQGFLLHYGFIHGNDIFGVNEGEIASPLYPYTYKNEGLYTWRITVKGSRNIIISIKMLEIPKHSEVCNSQLIIYDGYDEDAPVLEKLCGILRNNDKIFQSTSNVVFIQFNLDETNTGAIFYLKWTERDRNIDELNLARSVNCGSNTTLFVTDDKDVIIKSPNYPNVYKSDLNCEWIFKSTPGHHLTLKFLDFELEDTSSCLADYVSIYSSYSPIKWTALKENVCLSTNASEKIEASTYLKITFVTDHSLNRKGFMAVINSVCGSVLDNESGVIENPYDNRLHYIQPTCEWIIKVRPGRTIKLKFDKFNITNGDICQTYVVIRNGGSNESPLLGNGKFCGYAHENRSEIVSSSNYVLVRYVTPRRYYPMYQNFKLRYEEKNMECGVTSTLDSEHKWELISSPNYPSIPNPYTECVWKFTAPPGEILRIDFIDRFDLDSRQNCDAESIEIRDGSSRMSPLKGIFCQKRPSTIKTTSNTLFVKYSTQLPEPRNGFKANISIDICGATVISESGEIESPNYPHMSTLPEGTVCEWHIISTPGHTIKILFKDVDLPESDIQCETKITVEEPIPAEQETAMGFLKQFCDSDVNEYTDQIETNTNKVIVKLYIGKPSFYSDMTNNRGFKFSFNSSKLFCGGLITTSEGYITTPGYPRPTSLGYCQWIIELPNENRRVHLEIEDMNPNFQFMAFNDKTFSSKIIDTTDVTNSSNTPKIFESTGNKLSFYIFMGFTTNKMNRFKAKFNSNNPALCGGKLNGIQGEFHSPNLSRSYVCEWQYINDVVSNTTMMSQYNSIYITADVTASNRNICRYTDSGILIQSQIYNNMFSRKICGNNTRVSLRIPFSSLKFKAVQHTLPLSFNVKWKLQPCGGVIILNSNDPINILNVPDMFDEPIECGWILVSRNNVRFELKLEGSFNLECSDEYVTVNQGMAQMSLTMANYCKHKIPDHPLVSSFMYTYIQYHSGAQSRTNLKLFAKPVNVPCGGFLSKLERIFTSPNYPQNYKENQECSWEIQTDVGFRITLQFIDRFAIEDKVNCTKDVVIIYDWKDNTYNEMARLCGRNLPPAFNSTDNLMKVVFRSDANITLDGFKAQWTPICGGHFVATEKKQYLYSPGYSYGSYRPSLDCQYVITAPSKNIIITFDTFDVEGPYPDCKFDNLTISADNNYNYIYEVHCGNKNPRPIIAQDKIKLDFKTDKYSQKRGFKISYTIYTCGGRVTDPTAITLDRVGDNTNCTWSIEATKNKLVVLKFDYINVGSSYECYSDYVAVFEGAYINLDKRLALICGRINSTYVKSKGNKMILQFLSERNFESVGFKVKIIFSFTESVGCGGEINLTSSNNYVLRSPIINNAIVYENFLDCHWNIKAHTDFVIKVTFTSFHIAPCFNVNQTALGTSKCDCDYVTLKDGLNPNSMIISKYCGHDLPPILTSSGNTMSIILSTDGDITSSGFEATLSSIPSTCGQSVYTISKEPQLITSPGYRSGAIPRGLHCIYYLDSSLEPYSMIHVRVKYLDLQSGFRDQCDRDKLILYSSTKSHNLTIGKDYIWNADESDLIQYAHIYESSIIFPKRFILCGKNHSVDFYLTGSINMNLITSSDATTTYKGVEIEIAYVSFCSRNYSEPQGRIQNVYGTVTNMTIKDCYTLITAPENFTISIYFMSVSPVFWNEKVYIEFFDGKATTSPLLLKIAKEYPDNYPLFSSGRHMLLHHHVKEQDVITYDLNYITTDKGRGCGGKLYNELGRVTSPLYPDTYRRKSTCEWELETPAGTYLFLRFTTFDLGKLCDQNYISLIDRRGQVISTYCREAPADYRSPENYVKIAFTTTMNNGGTGWVADFVGTV